jgi:UDP-2,3-diacylglucosamine pyrophosphatase LpxH
MSRRETTLEQSAWSWPYRNWLRKSWRSLAFQRLDSAFANAPSLTYTEKSRFVFFSDQHRGDGGSTDRFAPNKTLFLDALRYYYENDYTYIEVGDGDEMWLSDNMTAIVKAHSAVFEWLHRFHEDGRLHILFGNHDIVNLADCPPEKDGLPTIEGLILQSRNGRRLFVCHGHQADYMDVHLFSISRLTNRYLWKPFRAQGFGRISPPQKHDDHPIEEVPRAIKSWLKMQTRTVENRIKDWAVANHQTIICGHTHHAIPPAPNGSHSHYINTGNCITPGRLSGLELVNDQLTLVQWEEGKGVRRF